MARQFKKILLTLSLFLVCSSLVNAQDSRAIGLYVESFTKYFLWPDEPKSELVIGIYGESTAIAHLQKTLAGKKTKSVRNMPIRLKMLSSLSEIPACSILLISKGKSEEIDQINSLIANSPIILITTIPGYSTGPAVNIDTENNFNLEICSKNIRASGIKISTALTNLAKEI